MYNTLLIVLTLLVIGVALVYTVDNGIRSLVIPRPKVEGFVATTNLPSGNPPYGSTFNPHPPGPGATIYEFTKRDVINTDIGKDYFLKRAVPNQGDTMDGYLADKHRRIMSTDAYRNWKMNQLNTPEAVCILDHEHGATVSGVCPYGPTNYLNPREMAEIDRRLFKLNYPEKMTLQDYINWLWLYRDEEDKVGYDHLRNLQKLKNGVPLKYEAGVVPPPIKPEQSVQSYYGALYGDGIISNPLGPPAAQVVKGVPQVQPGLSDNAVIAYRYENPYA